MFILNIHTDKLQKLGIVGSWEKQSFVISLLYVLEFLFLYEIYEINFNNQMIIV